MEVANEIWQALGLLSSCRLCCTCSECVRNLGLGSFFVLHIVECMHLRQNSISQSLRV